MAGKQIYMIIPSKGEIKVARSLGKMNTEIDALKKEDELFDPATEMTIIVGERTSLKTHSDDPRYKYALNFEGLDGD